MTSRSDALYTYLLMDLGFPEGDPSPHATCKDYAKAYLARDVYKKLLSHINDDADLRALNKFKGINERCALWHAEWHSWEDELVGTLKEEIYKFWNPAGMPLVSSFAEVLASARPGPGASIGALANDFYTKMFASPMTATSHHLYDVYRRYFQTYPLWASAELSRQTQYGEVKVVEGSRISFVPKSNDISRCICIEPSLNMFFQLGFGACLEGRLRQYFGIDLALQPDTNRELARLGSINGNFATIDLSSASDSLSMKMLRHFLPRDFLAWLERLRSPVSSVGGESLELNMVSTMGNGFTFPLQTMLFSAVVCAALRHHGIKPERAYHYDGQLVTPGNWSVFGDDIIVPTDVVRTVLRLLDILGFEVNQHKTFVEGPFRESCGCDYFRGHNVRPVYIRSLDTQQDRYVAINLLNEWSARVGVSLSRSVQYLLSTVRFLAVPWSEGVETGVRLPYSIAYDHIKHDGNGTCKYTCYAPRPVAVKCLEGKFILPRSSKHKKLHYNPDGLLLTFLRGDIVRGMYPIRHDRVRYHTKARLIPYWDKFGPTGSIALPYNWRQWNTAVHLNLYG